MPCLVYVQFFYFASEVILGQFVRVAFVYIENMQTFASVLFGLKKIVRLLSSDM